MAKVFITNLELTIFDNSAFATTNNLRKQHKCKEKIQVKDDMQYIK